VTAFYSCELSLLSGETMASKSLQWQLCAQQSSTPPFSSPES
jgi:hypothetical protein